MDGILLINKHSGVTSAEIVRKIKNIYNLKKVGHAGTLDPFATGLLVCCLNRATKLSNFFLYGNKVYRGVLRLGVKTNTQDYTGKIINEKLLDHLKIKKLFDVICNFNGQRYQLPPLFSALKFSGIPLYKFSREGINLKRKTRPLFIKYFKIYDIKPPKIFFEVCCSSGSYVRAICSSIGDFLYYGAHLESLHRLSSSFFSVNFAHCFSYIEKLSIQDFFYNCVIPMSGLINFIRTFNKI